MEETRLEVLVSSPKRIQSYATDCIVGLSYVLLVGTSTGYTHAIQQ